MRFAYLIEPPFNHVTPDGKITGCDVDLARHIFNNLGTTPDFVEAEFAELLPGLADGRWEMTTGLFATSERRKQACFSRPIWALPDGLLVAKGNPLGLQGYASLAAHTSATLAVIRDQVQHRTARDFGVSETRVRVLETYEQAADAVRTGAAAAYASVARAHAGYIAEHPECGLDFITVSTSEKQPAFGAYAFALGNEDLRNSVDDILSEFLGSPEHHSLMSRFGFTSAEVDLVAQPSVR